MLCASGTRATVLATAASLGLLAGLATGCGTIDDTRQVLNHADLVNDLASRLDNASELTYLAKYQLASGATATITQAQSPRRSAYAYPSGKVVLDNKSTARCQTTPADTACTLTDPLLTTSALPAGLLDAANSAGLVQPTLVTGMLTTAALDGNSVIEQSDSTIAGQHATCVNVRQVDNLPPFAACVTTDGVLGSFSGSVNGQAVEVTLIDFTAAVPADAFDLPVGAKVTDSRSA